MNRKEAEALSGTESLCDFVFVPFEWPAVVLRRLPWLPGLCLRLLPLAWAEV
jgi:hypothetical protein